MKAALLVSMVKGRLGQGYAYGCYSGTVLTEAILTAKAKQFPNQYTSAYILKTRKWLGKPVQDCSGLIKGCYWIADFNGRYQAASDFSANSMFNACLKKGPISTIPEQPGIIVHKDKHVGVYIGNKMVVESRGVDSGVVLTRLDERPWTSWGVLSFIDYSIDPMEARALAAEAQVAKLKADLLSTTENFNAKLKEFEFQQTTMQNQLDVLKGKLQIVSDFGKMLLELSQK